MAHHKTTYFFFSCQSMPLCDKRHTLPLRCPILHTKATADTTPRDPHQSRRHLASPCRTTDQSCLFYMPGARRRYGPVAAQNLRRHASSLSVTCVILAKLSKVWQPWACVYTADSPCERPNHCRRIGTIATFMPTPPSSSSSLSLSLSFLSHSLSFLSPSQDRGRPRPRPRRHQPPLPSGRAVSRRPLRPTAPRGITQYEGLTAASRARESKWVTALADRCLRPQHRFETAAHTFFCPLAGGDARIRRSGSAFTRLGSDGHVRRGANTARAR